MHYDKGEDVGYVFQYPQNFEEKNSTTTNMFQFYKTFCSENIRNYLLRYSDWLFKYPNTIQGPNKIEYRIQILLFDPTIYIVFEYKIIFHTLNLVRDGVSEGGR